jgi:hypothetical protein
MRDENKRCAQCEWYEGDSIAGFCHRFPPAPDRAQRATEYSEPPLVPSDHWCGEWAKAKGSNQL